MDDPVFARNRGNVISCNRGTKEVWMHASPEGWNRVDGARRFWFGRCDIRDASCGTPTAHALWTSRSSHGTYGVGSPVWCALSPGLTATWQCTSLSFAC